MGITTYLFHKSSSLEKQRFNMFFLDMGENIHFHYRDLRIELSVGEFIELAEQFNRYAKEVLREIDKGYQDGVLANTNEAGTLKTFWDKEKRLVHSVKYNERQLAIEETKDGFHLHIRNYKILLYKESFQNLIEAMAPILPVLNDKNRERDPFLLLEQNELQPKLLSRLQTENDEQLVVEVSKTYRNKAGQVLKAIGFSQQSKSGKSWDFIKGVVSVKLVLPGTTIHPAADDVALSLPKFFQHRGKDLDAAQLNVLKLKILSLLKMAEKGEIPSFTLEQVYIDPQQINPTVSLFGVDQKGEPADELERFSKLLARHKLFFIKPQKKYLSEERRRDVEDAFFSFVMEKLAVFEGVKKIYVLGSSTYHGLGDYAAPFVHFDWVKLNSDFDIYIELDPEFEGDLPGQWQKKFYWERAGSDYYHFGELGDGMSSELAQEYPLLRFYDHLIEGYLFNPKSCDKKKRDSWFKEIKAQCIFSRDKTAQWVSANYNILANDTEQFSVASFNRVYKVRSDSADYVLKIYDTKYLSSKNVKKISYEIKVLDALAGSGLNVAFPVKNREGKYISVRGREKAVVFTFVPGGYVAEPSKQQVQQAGRLLASFHVEAKKYKTTLGKNFGNKELVNYWLKAWPEYHQKKVVGTDVGVNVFTYLKILQDLKTFPTHCHGDLSLINYLFEDEQCWLIDFQSIGYGPALLDLTNGMVEFSARKDDFLFHNLKYFREGYESIRKLGKNEKEALNSLLIVQLIVRQAKLIRLHYGGFGYELKKERLLGLKQGLVGLINGESY